MGHHLAGFLWYHKHNNINRGYSGIWDEDSHKSWRSHQIESDGWIYCQSEKIKWIAADFESTKKSWVWWCGWCFSAKKQRISGLSQHCWPLGFWTNFWEVCLSSHPNIWASQLSWYSHIWGDRHQFANDLDVNLPNTRAFLHCISYL